MSDMDNFIKKILEEAKFYSKENFEDKVYTDEPIITTASKLPAYMPEKYSEMKKIALGQYGYHSLSRTFLMQARFMADFEDDYPAKCAFTCYYPTYRMMNDKQLRCYFTWRSRVRQGIIERTSSSYAFVYIYELLALVGADSAADAFCKLNSFIDEYEQFDQIVIPYAEMWLEDFIVYYGLSNELLSQSPVYKFGKSVEALKNLPDDNEVLFEALTFLSSYNIENSKMYKLYPQKTKDLICLVWRKFSEYCEKKKMRPAYERLFGNPSWHRMEMFQSAVFCDVDRSIDTEYYAGEFCTYKRKDGTWYRYSFQSPEKKNSKLGGIIKFIDSKLRESLGLPPLKAEGTKMLSDIIEKALEELYEEEKAKERKNITIDLTSLENIRNASVKTRESLLTDEERDLSTNICDATPPCDAHDVNEKTYLTDNKSQIPKKTDSSETHEQNEEKTPGELYGLTDEEREIIRCILNGEDADKVSRKFGIMLSIAIDSINEKLFDTVSDNVIYYDGDRPIAEEYYTDLLREII